MRSSRAFASASSLLLAGLALAAPAPEFFPEPSPVVAGRTLSIYCRTHRPLEGGRARVGETDARFYRMRRGLWRALIGIGPLEAPGPRQAVVTGRIGDLDLEALVDFEVVGGTYPVSRVRLAPSRDSLFTSGAVERDAERLAEIFTGPGWPKRFWEGSFLWPSTGVISSPFGAQRSYNDRPAASAHTGVDIANAEGTPILAPARGRVALSERLESFGHTVVLDHGHGVFSYYLHMQSSAVEAGDRVKPGRRLGSMGAEGVATGPHLHWSLAVAGVRVDPLEWIERDVP